jgi:hypothetical protein
LVFPRPGADCVAPGKKEWEHGLAKPTNFVNCAPVIPCCVWKEREHVYVLIPFPPVIPAGGGGSEIQRRKKTNAITIMFVHFSQSLCSTRDLDQADYAEAHLRLVHLHQQRFFSGLELTIDSFADGRRQKGSVQKTLRATRSCK